MPSFFRSLALSPKSSYSFDSARDVIGNGDWGGKSWCYMLCNPNFKRTPIKYCVSDYEWRGDCINSFCRTGSLPGKTYENTIHRVGSYDGQSGFYEFVNLKFST